jgi:hypothetical protein
MDVRENVWKYCLRSRSCGHSPGDTAVGPSANSWLLFWSCGACDIAVLLIALVTGTASVEEFRLVVRGREFLLMGTE